MRVSVVLVALAAMWGAAAKAEDAGDGLRPSSPDFAGIKALARQLASRPYVDHRQPVSPRLLELSYDQLNQITFNDNKSVWRRERLPFQMQFVHPGGDRKDQIDVNLVDGDEVTAVPFSREFFNYDANSRYNWADFRNAKFGGFRVLYPINRNDKLDEVIVFQGASYFRVVPAAHVYGLSARVLAVNCGVEETEEFPRFREFWVDRPDREGQTLKIRGVLDSESLVGAAEFTIEPGAETVTRVSVAIYPRVDVHRVGIAPLTSMYWFGKNTQLRFDDVRPEVHDSDGMQIQTGAGDWLWRPLDNTGRLRTSAFVDKGPKGFGLFQRETDPMCYQDSHAQYHRRPSAWIRPVGDWGTGSVRLVEIPTDAEFHDNIVAFWEPAQPLKAGESAEYSYDIAWGGQKAELPPVGRVVSTRSGAIPGQMRARRFVLDVACPGLEPQGSGFNVEPVVFAARGRIANPGIGYHAPQRTWRVSFDVAAEEGAETVELRVRLRKEGGDVCSETWTYCWTP
ncbi:MAG: glucan biosynthesis protein [Lentisphaerae bacterium]|nr:glucan biosynthesis protein [Lentisphaerota bacterium]